jgi:hypothetical protein
MNVSDGSVSPSDGQKLARARLVSAEASVTSAKKDAKAAKTKRKEAKEVERRARKRLRRAKKELREAKRVLAEAEESQPRPPRPRRLKPIEPAKTQTSAITPRIVRAKKKPRKRAVPALKADHPRRPSIAKPPVETISNPLIALPVAEAPLIAPPKPTPQAPSI